MPYVKAMYQANPVDTLPPVTDASLVEAALDAAVIEGQLDGLERECDHVDDVATALEHYLHQAIAQRRSDPQLIWARAQPTTQGLVGILRCAGFEGNLPSKFSEEHYHTDPLYTSVQFESSVQDFLRELWSRIQGYVKKMVIWFKELYLKYMSVAASLKRRAIDMRKAAMMRNRAVAPGKVNMRHFADLHIDKRAPDANQMVSTCDVYERAIRALTEKTVVASYADTLKDFEAALDQSFTRKFEHASFKLTKFDPVLTVFKRVSELATQGVSNSEVSFGVSDYVSVAHIPTKLVGNKYVYVAHYVQQADHMPEKASVMVFDSVLIRRRMSSTFARVAEVDRYTAYSVAETKEVIPFSAAEVATVCKAVESMAECILQYEYAWLHYEKQSAAFVKKMETFISKKLDVPEDNESEQQRRDFMANMANAGKDTVKHYTQSVKSLMGEALKTGRLSLDFCGDCLRHSK